MAVCTSAKGGRNGANLKRVRTELQDQQEFTSADSESRIPGSWNPEHAQRIEVKE